MHILLTGGLGIGEAFQAVDDLEQRSAIAAGDVRPGRISREAFEPLDDHAGLVQANGDGSDHSLG
jgi:hypothetical protein